MWASTVKWTNPWCKMALSNKRKFYSTKDVLNLLGLNTEEKKNGW